MNRTRPWLGIALLGAVLSSGCGSGGHAPAAATATPSPSATPTAAATTTPTMTAAQGCIASGGSVTTGFCCASASDFPNTCGLGACGCSPASSRELPRCDCGDGHCFDGTSCVAR